MAATNNTIELQAALDKAQSVKNINKDIDNIKKQLKPLEIQAKPDTKFLQNFSGMKKELENFIQKISLDISSQMSNGLKEAENSTNSSLSSMLGL